MGYHVIQFPLVVMNATNPAINTTAAASTGISCSFSKIQKIHTTRDLSDQSITNRITQDVPNT